MLNARSFFLFDRWQALEQAGVETCYPQILPHDRGIRCPGACSPYVQYPRPLDQDLFFAASREEILRLKAAKSRWHTSREGYTLLDTRYITS